jgi:hypothetical protein
VKIQEEGKGRVVLSAMVAGICFAILLLPGGMEVARSAESSVKVVPRPAEEPFYHYRFGRPGVVHYYRVVGRMNMKANRAARRELGWRLPGSMKIAGFLCLQVEKNMRIYSNKPKDKDCVGLVANYLADKRIRRMPPAGYVFRYSDGRLNKQSENTFFMRALPRFPARGSLAVKDDQGKPVFPKLKKWKMSYALGKDRKLQQTCQVLKREKVKGYSCLKIRTETKRAADFKEREGFFEKYHQQTTKATVWFDEVVGIPVKVQYSMSYKDIDSAAEDTRDQAVIDINYSLTYELLNEKEIKRFEGIPDDYKFMAFGEYPKISPDGRYLWFVSMDKSRCVLDLTVPGAKALDLGVCAWGPPYWIAGTDVFIMNLERVTEKYPYFKDVKYDAKLVKTDRYYVGPKTYEPDKEQCRWLVNSSGKLVRKLWDNKPLTTWDESPDGKWVAFIENKQHSKVTVVSINGKQKPISFNVVGKLHSRKDHAPEAKWLPDSSGLAYSKSNIILSLAEKRAVPIHKNIPESACWFNYSPDMKKVLYETPWAGKYVNRSCYFTDLETGKTALVTSKSLGEWIEPFCGWVDNNRIGRIMRKPLKEKKVINKCYFTKNLHRRDDYLIKTGEFTAPKTNLDRTVLNKDLLPAYYHRRDSEKPQADPRIKFVWSKLIGKGKIFYRP